MPLVCLLLSARSRAPYFSLQLSRRGLVSFRPRSHSKWFKFKKLGPARELPTHDSAALGVCSYTCSVRAFHFLLQVCSAGVCAVIPYFSVALRHPEK